MASGALQIRINPYPTRWRLPGDRTPSRQHLPAIDGIARKCIAHALTYYEIPPNVDAKIEALPSEDRFEGLNPLQREYLSFAVYSLKQMVAAGTISAETAWGLFFGEWDGINEVEEESFSGMRQTFVKNVRKEVGRTDLTLLQFEFYARAGEAGLAQFERYSKWAGDLIFDEETCKDMRDVIKDEYRKALWLEMRIIERAIGISGLNDDLGKFFKLGLGGYAQAYARAVRMMISIFNEKYGSSIDSTVKAEMGHWMFDRLCINSDWVGELMDRMNNAGYTERVNSVFSDIPEENLPPEARVFFRGGNYSGCFGAFVKGAKTEIKPEAVYPSYPERLPEEIIKSSTKNENFLISVGFKSTHPIVTHITAEVVERMIRGRIIRAVEAKEINGNGAYEIYRKMGLYIALLSLEKRTNEEILEKIESFNIKEIEEYYDAYKRR